MGGAVAIAMALATLLALAILAQARFFAPLGYPGFALWFCWLCFLFSQ